MRLEVFKNKNGAWELRKYENGIVHVMGTCANMTYERAIGCFAANWPEYAAALDAQNALFSELCGTPAPLLRTERPKRHASAQKRRGSGLRFRELMAGGATNAEALATVRLEFPESKATLSDAAWNRARLQKEKATLDARPSLEDLI